MFSVGHLVPHFTKGLVETSVKFVEAGATDPAEIVLA